MYFEDVLLGVCSSFVGGFLWVFGFFGKIVNRAFPRYSSRRVEAVVGMRVHSLDNMHAEYEKFGVVFGHAFSQNFSVPFFVLKQPVNILCLSCK